MWALTTDNLKLVMDMLPAEICVFFFDREIIMYSLMHTMLGRTKTSSVEQKSNMTIQHRTFSGSANGYTNKLKALLSIFIVTGYAIRQPYPF